ncbi:MAG: DUF2283 domain-containing protein [Oscillospiraceae bacterium]|nr:DUF2283 domain-containing protein [Oscillospiraceae bacterium]
MQAMRINYDRRFDTLYVTFTGNENSYGDDSLNSVILMRDLDTDAITGMTILSFMKKVQTNSLPKLPSEVGISIEKDILPKLKQ